MNEQPKCPDPGCVKYAIAAEIGGTIFWYCPEHCPLPRKKVEK